MTIGSILLGLALIVLVGLFVARPFILRPERGGRLTSTEALVTHKEALLTRVRELDFDYETGKIAAEEHQRQRLLLMNEAAGVLRQLDGMDEGKSQIPNPKPQQEGQGDKETRRQEDKSKIQNPKSLIGRLRRRLRG